MKESNETPLILNLSFCCKFAEEFDLNIELVDANRVQGLQNGWDKAIEHYCPNQIEKMQRQLKRKLGSIFNFHDQTNVILRFMNANGQRDEITVTTNYATIG